jgi:hypothetical protein
VADDKDAHGAVVSPGGLSAAGSGGISTTRVSEGDVGDAHVVTHGKGRSHFSLSLAVEHAEHAADQSSVDSADHWMLDGGPAERAVFGHDPQSTVAFWFGSGGEAVGGEGVGDCVECRAEGPLDIFRSELGCHRSANLGAYLFG